MAVTSNGSLLVPSIFPVDRVRCVARLPGRVRETAMDLGNPIEGLPTTRPPASWQNRGSPDPHFRRLPAEEFVYKITA